MHEKTQIEFADQIGVSQGTLSEIEQNKYNPSVEVILRIHDKYETDIEWLLTGRARADLDHKKEFSITGYEFDILQQLRKLSQLDREEVEEIIMLKLKWKAK
ncbi:helix-turn-helix domain-containing protein [Paenibacillus rhizovicinus]|uniref:helix-turn-helix domain-containing protein n=1 Tax=Paenibacillus rhizovicinus TaxID=2704463 RepID=UPI001CDC888F|nr:helix-turn-helix transcriptional regulator [Paenibacillus rhizovicinus]